MPTVPVPIDDKTATDLSWPVLLQKLAERCHTSLGIAQALKLCACDTLAAAQTRQREIAEARALADLGEPLPFGGISDVAAFVERSEKSGVLVPEELIEIGKTLRSGQRLRRHVLARTAFLPQLCLHAEQIAELASVSGPITDSFNDHGVLVDRASPALSGLRLRVKSLTQDLAQRTDRLLNEEHIEPHLQDRFVTQREERYVVPVRADARTKIRGIVHGVSASGATVYVEPEEVIELNNRLKLAQLEVSEEERRILAELSRLVEQAAAAILQNLRTLAYLDLIDAAARLAQDLRAHPVELIDAESGDSPRIDLRNARHPLMVLSSVQVVQNDVLLPLGCALLLSGPNAGGKTVALKLTGLCVLMSRAGLHIPAQEGSTLPWFDTVLTDVGDDQSIEKNLSTFSAHMSHLCSFLRQATVRTLVLLDEIAVGTDPEQGSALAQAVLEGLVSRGATVLVTTHYDRCKALAADTPKFHNASVGFDLSALRPTYKLHLGIPGPSLALPVAQRLGLPTPLIGRAETLLQTGRSDLDRLMQTLTDEREKTQSLRTEAERLRKTAQAELAESRRIHEEARIELQKARRKALDETLAALQAARRELTDLKAALKSTRNTLHDDAEQARSVSQNAQRKLDELSENIRGLVPAPELAAGQTPTENDLTIGTPVSIPRLQAKGVVAQEATRGKVVLQVGALRMTADVSELVLLPAAGKRPVSAKPALASGETQSVVPPRTALATLDLRGERLPVALARSEKFVDDALLEHRPAVFILHGHGTGILRNALREHFSRFPGVRKMYPAGHQDGGDGVTVLELDV